MMTRASFMRAEKSASTLKRLAGCGQKYFAEKAGVTLEHARCRETLPMAELSKQSGKR
jgi:hypothetical protein